MFADSTPLRPFSATPEMIRNPNFVFPVRFEDSPSGSPIDQRFARRSSVPHALGPVPVIPAALESRPRSSGSAATLLAGVGILPPPPVIPTTSRSNSPVGNAPASPFNFGSGRPIAQRTSGLGAPKPVTIGPVPQVASRLRNASGVDGNGSDMAAPASAGEEKSSEKSLAPVNKAPMRRGHAHRRSGAVSSSDVWALMNASAPALSMPKESPPPVSTPPPNSQPSPVVSWSAPVSPGLITPQKTPVLGPIDSAPQDAAAKRAARVSFVEHVDIIPRPLSAASSDATVKGHFGGESISSLASFNSLVQPAFPTQSMSRTRSNSHSSVARFPPLVIPANLDRPSTAGAILNSPIDSPIEGLSRNGSLKRNVDTAITPTTPPPSKKIHKKAISEFALASFPKFSSDTTTKNTNANARISFEDDSTEGSSTPTNDEDKKKKKKKSKGKGKGKGKGKNKENRETREENEEGQSKKNKKKGWGLGKKVLGKQPKNRQLKALPRRSPTPPLPRSASGERIGGAEWVAAWNESYVIVPPNFGENSPSFLGAGESSPHSVESDSPIIDLDAALGPFKTPQNVRGNFRAAKRYMHSSGRPAGTFGGPSFVGLHKRSESLPETRMEMFALDENEGMEMGDVFEEEDEDDSSSSSACSSAGDSEYQNEGVGIGINIVDVDGESTSSRRGSDAMEDDMARSAQGSRRGSASSTKSCKSLKSAQLKPRSSSHSMKVEEQPISPVMEEDEHLSPSPTIKKSREHFRVSIISSSTQSSTSTVTPTTLPVPDAPTASGNSPATSMMSLSTPYEESSPANNHSEIYLAASETGSGFLGEPSPDMRMSCDDVPSLTSCSSTMTGIVYREPATPGAGESIKEGKSGKKSKKEKKEKRWSRVFGFLKIKS